MSQPIRWGIIGTGTIARTFARGLFHCPTGTLVAVGSRTPQSAGQFVQHHCPGTTNVRAHGSYEALLADPQVQAVYISTPHPQHARWAIAAAAAGKHILCEKPIGLNLAEAQAIIEAARRHDVFLMEAYMYRCHPQTARVLEIVRSGALGQIKMIQATFGFHAPFDPASRLYSNALGGGGILDVGGYPVSMARLIAGAALGEPIAEPAEIHGAGHLGATGIDEHAAAVLKFPGQIVAQVATSVAVELENVVRIHGSQGWLLIPDPWIPAREGGVTKIIHQPHSAPATEILVRTDQYLYALEADAVAEGVHRMKSGKPGATGDPLRGQALPPAMTWADTLGNMATLDAWRRSFNFQYEAEKAGE